MRDVKAGLQKVEQGNLCAGCGACAGLWPEKIQMEMQAPGYLRPRQIAPLEPGEESVLRQICPGLGQSVTADGRQDSALWGPYVDMQLGWATDDEVRFQGSSGGGLSAMLTHLLATDQVDAVIQTEASVDVAIGNQPVVTTDVDGVLRAAGSRYAPSAPLADLSRLIADGRRFAFVGKPCDAQALRAVLGTRPELAAQFPVILSFFCAGVPSETGGKAVLAALGTELPAVDRFRFRGNGWPGEATATLKDGSSRGMSYHDSWGKILSKHVQHRCKVCADGTGVAADIVCADAWESDDKGYPVFQDAPGISLMVARTPLGQKLIQEAKATGVIDTQPYDVAGLAQIQPGQRERRRALLARLTALRLVGKPIPRYRGLRQWEAARQNPLSRNLKNFLGMLRRTLRARS